MQPVLFRQSGPFHTVLADKGTHCQRPHHWRRPFVDKVPTRRHFCVPFHHTSKTKKAFDSVKRTKRCKPMANVQIRSMPNSPSVYQCDLYSLVRFAWLASHCKRFRATRPPRLMKVHFNSQCQCQAKRVFSGCVSVITNSCHDTH